MQKKTIKVLVAALLNDEKAGVTLNAAVKAAKAAKVSKTALRNALKETFGYDDTEGKARRALDTRISKLLRKAGYAADQAGGRGAGYAFKVSDRLFDATLTFLRKNNVQDADMKAALTALAASISLEEVK